MPQTAKIFKSGNSQAVRLPKEFRFDVDEVEITREGDAVVLRPRDSSATRWENLFAAMENGLSDDFMANEREQPPMPPDDPRGGPIVSILVIPG